MVQILNPDGVHQNEHKLEGRRSSVSVISEDYGLETFCNSLLQVGNKMNSILLLMLFMLRNKDTVNIVYVGFPLCLKSVFTNKCFFLHFYLCVFICRRMVNTETVFS